MKTGRNVRQSELAFLKLINRVFPEMKTRITNGHAPTREEISVLAYSLYEQRGCECGHELDDWLEAERRLQTGSGQEPVSQGAGTSSHNGQTAFTNSSTQPLKKRPLSGREYPNARDKRGSASREEITTMIPRNHDHNH